MTHSWNLSPQEAEVRRLPGLYNQKTSQKKKKGPGEMTRHLRALTTLPQDLVLIPSTHFWWLSTPVPRDPIHFSGFCGHQACKEHTIQATHTHTGKEKIMKERENKKESNSNMTQRLWLGLGNHLCNPQILRSQKNWVWGQLGLPKEAQTEKWKGRNK